MLKPTLLLLAFGLDLGNSMCFRDEKTNDAREVIGRPKVVDEYHCKIICTEREDCLSYTYRDRECTLNGEKSAADVGPSQEWVKRTSYLDCKDTIAQTDIDAEYIPNPALAQGTTQIDKTNITFKTRNACPSGTIMDTILPDNSHVVQGGESRIEWDERLGSWKVVKMIEIRPKFTVRQVTQYIRAARCFDIDPTKFSDTSSCGGSLPEITIGTVPRQQGPVQKYGVLRYCKANFKFIWDRLEGTNSDGEVAAMGRYAGSSYVTCIGGSWIVFVENGGKINGDSFKITNGTCVA